MGPLVPDVFSEEFSLLIAVLSGIGFGFFLEQAGFSSSRKLVGLFYGYDFTVLRVFFTAGVTAMIGILLLHNFGLLDLSLVYVNPTFLWSALVGGAIMGVGFLIGGYCPGTSLCALSIGRLDAFVFVGGALIGILGFTEGYPLLESLYTSENWGALRFNELLGWSLELFAFVITVIAALAFWLTGLIEKKVNGEPARFSPAFRNRFAAVLGAAVLIVAFVAIKPTRAESIRNRVQDPAYQKQNEHRHISIDKLAYDLMHDHYRINLIDVRDKQAYDEFHLPLAVHIPFDEMQQRAWSHYYTRVNLKNVFYSDDPSEAVRAALLANLIGKTESYYITESPAEFRKMFYESEAPPAGAGRDEMLNYRFRRNAAQRLRYLEEALKRFSSPVKRKIKKVQGGC